MRLARTCLLLTITACSSSAGIQTLVPEERVAEDITLSVFHTSDFENLSPVAELHLDTEGGVLLDMEGDTDTDTDTDTDGQPFCNTHDCITYASAEGFYTEVYRGVQFEVDLDAVPEASHAVAGLITTLDYHIGFFVVRNGSFEISGYPVTTDDQGRFGVAGLPPGDLHLYISGKRCEDPLTNTPGTDYYDIFHRRVME